MHLSGCTGRILPESKLQSSQLSRSFTSARAAPASRARRGSALTMPLALLKRADGVEATWSSKGDEVCITVAIDKATRRNDISCKIMRESLTLTLSGKACLEGTLPHRISPDDSMWQIDTEGDKKSITIVLQKEARVEWDRLFEGEAERSSPAVPAKPPVAAPPAPARPVPTPAATASAAAPSVDIAPADLEAGASLLRRVQDAFTSEAQRVTKEVKAFMDAGGSFGGDQGAASSKERVIRLPESTLFTRPVFRSGFEVLEDPAADERRCVASRDIEAGEAILIEHGLEAASRSALVLALSCDGALREHLWPRRGRGGSPGLQGEVPADIKASEASAVSAAVARLGYMEVMAAKENNCFIKDPEFATRAGAQAAVKDKEGFRASPRRMYLYLSTFNDCLPGLPNASFTFVPTPWGVFAYVEADRRIAAGEEITIFYGDAHGRPWLKPEELAAGMNAVKARPPPPPPPPGKRQAFAAGHIRAYLESPTAAAAHRMAAQMVLNSRADKVMEDGALAAAAKEAAERAAAPASGAGAPGGEGLDAGGMSNEIRAIAGIGAPPEEQRALARLCAEALLKAQGRWAGIARGQGA